MRTWQMVMLVAGMLAVGGVVRADGTPPPKAWEVPGTKAGDEITGPDGGKMVWVPAGEFMMGTADTMEFNGQDLLADAKPVHKVRITKGFWLGKCTVTTAQWQRYLVAANIQAWPGSALPTSGPYYPAWCMIWEEATAYCKHYGLSLPTEAQWEYAAAGPESRKYPWGNDWDPKKCCNADNLGTLGTTWPVGSFPQGASWCGALDMAGSVEEWCQDWYADKYYAHSPTNDPPGPDTGTGRVVRGGFWGSDADMCRSADRSDRLPTDPSVCMGFRCTYTPGVVAPAPAAVPAAPTAPVLTPVEAGAIGSVVRISTPKGDIVIELFDRQSPITTGSFLLLAQKGFYNGLTFHRVVPGFVIQGGDPKGDGTGGPGFTLPDEFDPKIPFDRGIVAMAKTDDPNSAGSQFFVCLGGPDAVGFLTGHYAAFGRVLEGMDVADKIVVGDKMTAVTVLKESADAAKARAAAAVCRIPG